jgi:hypothetical protein
VLYICIYLHFFVLNGDPMLCDSGENISHFVDAGDNSVELADSIDERTTGPMPPLGFISKFKRSIL